MSYTETLRIRVERRATTVLLRLVGEFDMSSVERVEAALDSTLKTLTRRIVFDLSEVTFLDLAGIVTLIRANERSHSERFDVQIVRPAGLARRVFTLTGAGGQLSLIDAVEDVAQSHGHPSSSIEPAA